MFSHHPDTNPHFSPSDPASHQAAPALSRPALEGVNQPRRPRTRRPRLEPPHYHPSRSHPEPGLESQGQGRPHGSSGATVLLQPEGTGPPDNYRLHSEGKVSLHMQPPSPARDEHAPSPGKRASSVTGRSDKNQHQHSDLRAPKPGKTKFPTWFIAVCCALFCIVIIVGGLIVLVIYLVFRPHIPQFNISSASLNAAYLDVDYLLNADLTLLANFTNPNRKVRVDFSYVILDLYYGTVPIATQYVEPFSAVRSETKLASVHMISSQVRLPPSESQRLSKQIEGDGPVLFEVKGLFRARSNLGSLLRYSYPLYGHCFISLTGPPSGVLKASRCRTKR